MNKIYLPRTLADLAYAKFHLLLKRSFILVGLLCSINASAAVVLQYHHIGDDTPRITSVTQEELRTHINWLLENNFTILPLIELVERVKNKSLDEQARIASISFDDISLSICTNAWPILKEFNIPFTLFITTSTMQQGNAEEPKNTPRCTWEEIKTMHASGLATIGNHTHSHPHMLSNNSLANFFIANDKQSNKKEITFSQSIIDKALGPQYKIFAYPYGEYNKKVEQLITKLGYIGFGQQSGAIGNQSNLTELPRFPMSGQYANMKTVPDKLLSLPFPLQEAIISENPAKNKNPSLTLFFIEDFNYRVQCYLGNGTEIETIQEKNSVSAHAQQSLKEGRVRYNCTAPSAEKGRFYWFSQQWLYEE